MPQPSKFTAARREQVLDALRFGSSQETAAWNAGIDPATLSRWLDRAEKAREGGTWAEFWLQVCKARSHARLALTRSAFAAATNDGALAWKMAQRLEPAFRPEVAEVRPIGPIIVKLELPDAPRLPRLPSSTVEVLSDAG